SSIKHPRDNRHDSALYRSQRLAGINGHDTFGKALSSMAIHGTGPLEEIEPLLLEAIRGTAPPGSFQTKRRRYVQIKRQIRLQPLLHPIFQRLDALLAELSPS